MINYSDIATCTSQLVGYRNSDDTCDAVITGAATGATSNIYVTDVPGITPQLLDAAKSNSYGTLSDYVNDVILKEAQNAMKDFVRRHKELTRARNLMDNVDIVKNVQHLSDTVTGMGRFVGVRLNPQWSDNIKVWVRQIGLQFNAPQPSLDLYLFETTQETAIKTNTVAYTKTNSLEWFDLKDDEWFVYYKDKAGGTGQRFYLGYFETDLVAATKAIDTQFICAGCGSGDFWKPLNKHVGISGLQFNSTHLNGTSLPDTKQEGLTDQTYGIHLKLSVTCDITETLCNNIDQFDRLIQHKAAIRHFKDYFNTIEIGRESEIAKNNALTNLEMAENDYKEILMGLKLDFTDLDSLCFPCSKNFNKSAQLYQ